MRNRLLLIRRPLVRIDQSIHRELIASRYSTQEPPVVHTPCPSNEPCHWGNRDVGYLDSLIDRVFSFTDSLCHLA